jgi:glycosyltransferase involved in cell wall biosynthesis
VRALILEPHASGHHANYLRWLVQAADRKQWSVVIATNAAALAHPSVGGLSSEYGNVQFHLMGAFNRADRASARSALLIRREFAYWQSFRKAANEVRAKMSVDVVILPYIDYCFYALAILGSPFKDLPWCAISMRLAVPKNALNTQSPLPWKWRLVKRVLGARNLKALFDINPSVRDVPAKWLSAALRSKLRYLPDPAEYKASASRSESRATLGLSDGDIAILVFGSIDERKGVDSLLSNLSSQSRFGNYVVILAGKQSACVQRQMQTRACGEMLSRKRMIVIDRFLPDAEQNLVLTAADVVWVGYRNHSYMSGVLVLAGRAGLPIVGTSEGEIGRLIARYNLGIAANIDRPAEVYGALHAMLDARTRTEMGQKAHSAFAGHTVENFGASIMTVF